MDCITKKSELSWNDLLKDHVFSLDTTIMSRIYIRKVFFYLKNHGEKPRVTSGKRTNNPARFKCWQKTIWKDPPCDFHGNIHENPLNFDWAIFNSCVYVYQAGYLQIPTSKADMSLLSLGDLRSMAMARIDDHFQRFAEAVRKKGLPPNDPNFPTNMEVYSGLHGKIIEFNGGRKCPNTQTKWRLK